MTGRGAGTPFLTARRSAELFESGLYCAESVLQAMAEALDEDCAAIPRTATGLCSGVARSCGLCGALSGAILGIGLAMGRNGIEAPVDAIYQAVRRVRDRFELEFGSSNCLGLTGCDLGTEAGQQRFKATGQHARCRSYVTRATEWAMAVIDEDLFRSD